MTKKLYIFRKGDALDFFHIRATSPMLAIRRLVAKHGQQPYALVAITETT